MSKFTVISTAADGDITVKVDPEDVPSLEELIGLVNSPYVPFMVLHIGDSLWCIVVMANPNRESSAWRSQTLQDTYGNTAIRTKELYKTAHRKNDLLRKIGWLATGAIIVAGIVYSAKKLTDG